MRPSGILTSLWIFLIVGCGQINSSSKLPDRYLDAKLQIYLHEFLIDAKTLGVAIDQRLSNALRVMKFVTNVDDEKVSRGQEVSGEPGTIGTCANFDEQKSVNAGFRTLNSKQSAWSEVWIDDDLFSKATDSLALKEIVYHELGHCLLNLEHAQQNPHTIMSPQMSLDGKWLSSHWQDLVKGLFNPSK